MATVLMGFIILPYGIPDDVKKLLVQFVVEMHKYVVTDRCFLANPLRTSARGCREGGRKFMGVKNSLAVFKVPDFCSLPLEITVSEVVRSTACIAGNSQFEHFPRDLWFSQI